MTLAPTRRLLRVHPPNRPPVQRAARDLPARHPPAELDDVRARNLVLRCDLLDRQLAGRILFADLPDLSLGQRRRSLSLAPPLRTRQRAGDVRVRAAIHTGLHRTLRDSELLGELPTRRPATPDLLAAVRHMARKRSLAHCVASALFRDGWS